MTIPSGDSPHPPALPGILLSVRTLVLVIVAVGITVAAHCLPGWSDSPATFAAVLLLLHATIGR